MMKYDPTINNIPFKQYMLNEAIDPLKEVLLVISQTCMKKLFSI